MGEEIPGEKMPENAPQPAIERLPAELGFFETDEMAAIREEAIRAVSEGDWPLIHRLRNQYHKLGEAVIEQMEGPEAYDKGSIALTITIALIMRDGGRPTNYGADLQNAHLHAWNKRYDDIVAILESEMAAVGEEVEVREPREPRPAAGTVLSDEYKQQLRQLAGRFEAESEPVEVAMEKKPFGS